MLTFADFIRNMSEPIPNHKPSPCTGSLVYLDMKGTMHVQIQWGEQGTPNHSRLGYNVGPDVYRVEVSITAA